MISGRITKIKELKDSIKKVDDELKDIIFTIIDRVATMQVANKVGRFIHIVNFSEISGKLWGAEYYFWEHNAKILKDKLKEKNGVECYDYIMKLPNSKTKMGNYEIKYYVSNWFGRYEIKYPLNNEYIDKLISVLNE
jgi:hypothetical protein